MSRARIKRFCRLFDEGHDKAFCIEVSGVGLRIGERLWRQAIDSQHWCGSY